VVISFLTRPPSSDTMRFTWYGATPEEKAATRASWSASDVVLSAIVLLAVVLFYVAFW
jgi:solute:Na+ symporter, SSS family